MAGYRVTVVCVLCECFLNINSNSVLSTGYQVVKTPDSWIVLKVIAHELYKCVYLYILLLRHQIAIVTLVRPFASLSLL